MRESISKILQVLDLGPETGKWNYSEFHWVVGWKEGCGEQQKSVWDVIHEVKQDLKAELWQGHRLLGRGA